MTLIRIVLGVAMASLLGGCWWLRQAPPAPQDPPGSRIAAWRLTRIGVVPFADATHQGVGRRVADGFAAALTAPLGGGRVVRLGDRPGTPVGLLGIGQARQLGRDAGVDGLLTGQVLTHAWQRRPARVFVTVALRLLDANRGSIIWSRTATGTAAVRDPSAENVEAGYDEATALAAKELLHDLMAPPPQARAPRRGRDAGRRDAG